MQRLEEVLNSMISADAQTNELLGKLRLNYSKRFWNELGDNLLQLVYLRREFDCHTIVQTATNELNVYLDPLVAVELLDACFSRFNVPLDQVEQTLKKFAVAFSKNDLALNYLKITEAKANVLSNNFEKGISMLQEAEKFIDAQRSVPKIVYATMSYVRATNYWKKNNFEAFQKSLNQYLAYEDDWKFSPSERLELAERGIISALISDNVLSFGEMATSPFFSVLKDVPNRSFLWGFIDLFNKGKVDEFEKFVSVHSAQIQRDPLITLNIEKLRKKIRTIALYDSIFFSNQHFAQQSLSFDQVAKITQLDRNQVEKLLVHILSIGVLKGYISETTNQFFITGLKPQELDKSRLLQLRDKFENWNSTVRTTIEFINQC